MRGAQGQLAPGARCTPILFQALHLPRDDDLQDLLQQIIVAHACKRLSLRLLLQQVALKWRLSYCLLEQPHKFLVAGDLFDLPAVVQDIIGQLIGRRDAHMLGMRAKQLLQQLFRGLDEGVGIGGEEQAWCRFARALQLFQYRSDAVERHRALARAGSTLDQRGTRRVD